MKTGRQLLFYLLMVLSILLIVISLLSLIYDLSFWYSKILDFPRLQYFVLGVLFLFFLVLLNRKWDFPSLLLPFGLIAVLVIHGSFIYPYLFGEKSVPDHQGGLTETEDIFDIIIANVLVTNRESTSFLEIVKQRNPDILLIMEVDDWWTHELQVLKDDYPYYLEYPLDNAYGMALYSRLPMTREEIKFLKHEDVPSFHTEMKLPSGNSFSFRGVHPVAPVPSERYPDNIDEKEVALLKIGKLVAGDALPNLVTGDFNDVSWSYTSRMFGKKGNLKNVRIGRGLYNSYNAKSLVFRWPLDHFFVTAEFALVELERLPKFGSDHFPMYARFVLQP